MQGMIRQTILVLVSIIVLSSCAPSLAVVISSEARSLEPFIAARLSKLPNGAGKRIFIIREGEQAKGRFAGTALISGAPIQGLEGSALGISRDMPELKNWAGPRQFLSAAFGKDNTYSYIPLFWDCFGVTRFDDGKKLPVLAGEMVGWSAIDAMDAKEGLSIAGGESDARGALKAFLGSKGAIAREIMRLEWVKDTFHFSRADTNQRYKPGQKLLYIETFRDFEAKNPPGHRTFHPLSVGPSSAYIISGPWLAFRLAGDKRVMGLAASLLGLLLDEGFQKEVGIKTGWMPGNSAAPDINTESRRSRVALAGSVGFIPSNGFGEAERESLDSVFADPRRYASER